MTSITDLVNSFNVNSEEFELIVYRLVIDNDVPFDNQEIDAIQNIIITSLNSRINNTNTRYSGLRILDKILPRCSKDILLKYGLLWVIKASQMFENVNSTTGELTLTCKVLGSLIKSCKWIPELHKQISMQNIKQLLNTLNASHANIKCNAVYYLIAVLLYHYPEVCERYQMLIKKMVLLQIDSIEVNWVNVGAKCYVLLIKATERSYKPPPEKLLYNQWTYNEVLLCNNLHSIMDTLFSGLIELESIVIWDQLKLPPISEENIIQYYNKQKQRFLNLCTYLSSLLSGYGENNLVMPHDILGLLCRGLAITPLYLKNRTCFKEQMLYLILPKLHIGLLMVLETLISQFAEELVPYGKTILQIFQQSLHWTSTVLENQVTFLNSKPFKNVKIFVYKCIFTWLTKLGACSGIETIANECVTFILKDVIPERERILLTVQQTKNTSKRAIRNFKNSQYENSPILNKGESASTSSKSQCLDIDLCQKALITLQNIFYCSGVFLKQTFYKKIQNAVIPLLYDFYLGCSEQNFYKNNQCRLELFKLLKAFQLNPHLLLAFPTYYCLEISQMAIHDVDMNIREEARIALAELEKIIHPAGPTLQLPRQEDPELIFENEPDKTLIATNKRNDIEQMFLQDEETDKTLIVTNKKNDIEQIFLQDEERDKTVIANNKRNDNDIIKEMFLQDEDTTKIPCKKPRIIASERITPTLYKSSAQQIHVESFGEDKEYGSKEHKSLNIDRSTDIDIENIVEGETVTHIAIENEKSHQESTTSIQTDRIVKTISEHGELQNKELQKKKIQDDLEDQVDMGEYSSLFHNKKTSH